MKRFRKAIGAGVGASIAGLTTALINGDQPATSQGWAALIGGCVGLGLLAGFATYQVRNEGPAVVKNGSEADTVL